MDMPAWHNVHWVTDPCYDRARDLRIQLIMKNSNKSNYVSTRDYERLTDYYRATFSIIKTNIRNIQDEHDHPSTSQDSKIGLQARISSLDQALNALTEEFSAIQSDMERVKESDPMEHSDLTECPSQLHQLVSNNDKYTGLSLLDSQNYSPKTNRSKAKPNYHNSDTDSDTEKWEQTNSKRARRYSHNSTSSQNYQPREINFESKNAYNELKEVFLTGNSRTTPNESKKIIPPKVRPITIKTPKTKQELKELCENIENKGHNNFTIKSSTTFTKFFPDTPQTYKEIAKIIDEAKIEHFLFPEKSTLPLKVVMKGLSTDSDVNEIESELKLLNLNVIKVTQMESFKDKKKLPLFQIQLEDSPQSKEIYNLKRFLFRRVRIENYIRPTRTIQCYNCQYFHHTSQNCKMRPRCVKCAESHLTKDCPNGTGQIDKIKCCNCDSNNHVASYRNCPKFPGVKNKIDSNYVKPGISYAIAANPSPSAPHGNPHQPIQTNSNPPPINHTSNNFNVNSLKTTINEIAEQLNCKNFAELLDKYQKCLSEMKKAEDLFDKFTIFMKAFEKSPPSAP